MSPLFNFLSEHIKLKATNKNYVYTSNRCLFCKGKGDSILRLNTKLKVVKCFNCGMSFKDVNYLKKVWMEKENYHLWLKTTKVLNREIVEKQEIEDGFEYPF